MHYFGAAGIAMSKKKNFKSGHYGSWPCKNVFEAWFLGGCEEIDAFRAVYALIATISGRTPMMFITLVKL